MFGEFEIWALHWLDESSKKRASWRCGYKDTEQKERHLPPTSLYSTSLGGEVNFHTNLNPGLLVFITGYIWRWILVTCAPFKTLTEPFKETQGPWGWDWGNVCVACKTASQQRWAGAQHQRLFLTQTHQVSAEVQRDGIISKHNAEQNLPISRVYAARFFCQKSQNPAKFRSQESFPWGTFGEVIKSVSGSKY
jgi:hypothetical protein